MHVGPILLAPTQVLLETLFGDKVRVGRVKVSPSSVVKDSSCHLCWRPIFRPSATRRVFIRVPFLGPYPEHLEHPPARFFYLSRHFHLQSAVGAFTYQLPCTNMAPSKEPTYSKDEKALCFHHELLYEAKVLDSKPSDPNDKKSPLHYRVHYKGWKNT